MSKSNLNLSRRRLILGALQGTGMLLLSGCEKMFNSLQENKKFLSLLESAEGASQGVQRLLTGKPQTRQGIHRARYLPHL